MVLALLSGGTAEAFHRSLVRLPVFFCCLVCVCVAEAVVGHCCKKERGKKRKGVKRKLFVTVAQTKCWRETIYNGSCGGILLLLLRPLKMVNKACHTIEPSELYGCWTEDSST